MTRVYTIFLRRLLGALLLSGLLCVLAQAQAPALQPLLLATAGATDAATITALASGVAGELYVAGEFTGSISLGGVALSSTGGTDAFVARVQAGTGAVQWVLPLTGTAGEHISSLCWHAGNLFVGGSFRSARLRLDAQEVANADPAAIGARDGFVAKLLDNGNRAHLAWAYSLGGPGDDQVLALAATADRLYVGGSFDSDALDVLGTPLPNSQPRPASRATTDGFVATLRDLGPVATRSWVQPLIGAGEEAITALAARGNVVYVGGEHTSVAGSLSHLGLLGMPSALQTTAFVGRLDESATGATPAWVLELRGNTLTRLHGLVPVAGSLYVAGTFDGGPLPLGADTLPNAGNTDAYVARLEDAGTGGLWSWGRALGSWGYDGLQALASDSQSLYAAGRFNSPTLAVGATTLSNPLPGPGLGLDAFVTRLSFDGSFLATQAIGGGGHAQATTLLPLGSQVYLGGSFNGAADFGTQTVVALGNSTVGFVAGTAFGPLATAARRPLPGVQLWPNPAPGRAELRLPAGTAAAPFALTLTDARGCVVLRREAPASAAGATIELELAGLAPGVYALRVQQGAAQAVQKLVVQ